MAPSHERDARGGSRTRTADAILALLDVQQVRVGDVGAGEVGVGDVRGGAASAGEVDVGQVGTDQFRP